VGGAGGEHEQQLACRWHRLGGSLEQQLAQTLRARRTAGLARDDYLAAGRPQPGGGPVDLGALTQAFATLEGDESAVHSMPPGRFRAGRGTR
jgi:hypothetical protein